jgi:hypothetical protein
LAPEKPENQEDFPCRKENEVKVASMTSGDIERSRAPLGLGAEFLGELASGLDSVEELAGARLILCGFEGDPNAVGPGAWRPRPWRPGAEVPFAPTDNAYTTVAAFWRAADGTYRRRTETFAAGLALMVDDVGTKVDRAFVEGVEPSWRIETSPGNEQWWYFLREPERDASRFDGLIRAFIAGKLLGADPGMSGVTRVGRLPGHANGKRAYGGWTTRVVSRSPRRHSAQELLDAFQLQIVGRRIRRDKLPTEDALERNRMFQDVYRWLDQRNLLKRHEPDPSGWTEMRCPWVSEHTAGADTGAAIREPAQENDWYGAFRCHHGHCAARGWSALTEWMAEESVEELERAASHATQLESEQ